MKIYTQTLKPKIFTLLAIIFISFKIQAQTHKNRSQFIDINGFKYEYKLQGKEHFANNTPIIIFESGAFGDLNNWNSIFDSVAEFSPVLAYSRSGIGQSEWNNIEPTAYNSAIQLHKLTQKLDLKNSFILVGHSWGGAIIRAYAGHYPDEVKALVYVDPIDFLQSKEEADQVYINIGVDPEKADKFHSESLMLIMKQINAPPGVIPETKAIDKFYSQNITQRKLGPDPLKPVVLFVGTKEYDEYPPVPKGIEKPWSDDHIWFKSEIENRIKYLSKWPVMFNNCYMVISPNATHHFQDDEPDLVIQMIKKMIKY